MLTKLISIQNYNKFNPSILPIFTIYPFSLFYFSAQFTQFFTSSHISSILITSAYYLLFMILKKSLSIFRNLTYTTSASLSFCSITQNYLENKKIKQQIKLDNIFIHKKQKLKNMRVKMTELSPSFFTKSLPFFENEKIIMPNKETNHVENSYVKLEIPVESEPELQFSLKKLHSNQIRIGRILEVMDSIAGMVGYRHCFGSLSIKNPFILVTGSVDSINLFAPINYNKNIEMEGYINRVGSTSMEIQINLYQESTLKSNALFTMIARDATDQRKGYICPKLTFENLSDAQIKKAQKRLKQAETNVRRRKREMSESFEKAPPKAQQIALLHSMFLKQKNSNHSSIPIKQTEITNNLVMHIQQRNVHNKIFGGFLMREMIQTGWITANTFLHGKDFLVTDITNIYFKKAVQIGSGLRITTRVTYVEKSMIIVTVQAYGINFQEKKQELSCCLQIFILTEKWQENVFPHTYEEGLQYLESRKAFNELFSKK